MAPLTRRRAYGDGLSATSLMAEYYRQRAGAGLIVAEGAQPSRVGQGYTDTPGLHDARQVASWRPVTDAVHEAGGRIYAQLMHTGRNSHSSPTDHSPPTALPRAEGALRRALGTRIKRA
ncbi:hypothetical protein GCM10010211_73620 [Streptomyces albospinus]|uniref:NADH:flavin oxidoreductase/NADH oxidase N-terminal domain-containing protein n=1 Tax=Streptomyces albospinus TaxID=285515 RepID=A0ABQ2VN97_9ACTN|nr:hypothetical protein GCM10010211_73620 [Streptomyces albospinus]